MRPISEIEANEYVWDMRPAPIAHSFVGYCKLPQAKRCSLLISYSEGNEMDHVSVSPMNRFTVPTWEDMCALKEICFCPEEDCYQVHPKQSEYLHGVGDLENVLHIWHPVNNRTIDDLAKLPDLPGEKATT